MQSLRIAAGPKAGTRGKPVMHAQAFRSGLHADRLGRANIPGCACGGGCPRCALPHSPLAPIEISHPSDKHEKDAEAVAEKVLRGDSVASESPPSVRPSRLGVLGPGQSLPADTRNRFEPRFNRDLGDIRVHTDHRSASAARSLHAQAFTLGQDIAFASGQFNPGTPRGDRLLAHELTHAVHHRTEARIHRAIEVDSGLDLDTMGYAATKSGNVYTAPRILRKSGLYNEVVTGLLGSPRVFKLKGKSDGEVNRNFKKQVNTRLAILAFARKKRYQFAAGTKVTMNPDYWTFTSEQDFEVKEDVDRQAAIADLNEHPQEYAISCFMASELTMESGGSAPVMIFGVDRDDWIPADWGYIENTSFSGTPGLEGENIIYAGNGQFWGHFGSTSAYKTLKEWHDLVESWDGGAALQSHRYIPFDGLE